MFFELGVTCVNFGVLPAFQNTKIETKQIFSVFFPVYLRKKMVLKNINQTNLKSMHTTFYPTLIISFIVTITIIQ